jgi:hypothetical protein
MGYVLAYVRGMNGIKYGQDFMVEDANTSGHVFRKLRLGQRAIAKKTLGAWDDVIRPDRIIICDDWPITLKWDAAF